MKKIFLSLILGLSLIVPFSFAKADTLQFYYGDTSIYHNLAVSYCDTLNVNGYDDWRLATYNESLIYPIINNQTYWVSRTTPESLSYCSPNDQNLDCVYTQLDIDNVSIFKSSAYDDGVCSAMNNGMVPVYSLCVRTQADTPVITGTTFDDLSSSTGQAVSNSVSNIFSLVGDNLIVILSLLAIILGLPFIIRLFKRFTK